MGYCTPSLGAVGKAWIRQAEGHGKSIFQQGRPGGLITVGAYQFQFHGPRKLLDI